MPSFSGGAIYRRLAAFYHAPDNCPAESATKKQVARTTQIGPCGICGRYAVKRAAVSKNSIQRVNKPSLTVQM